MTVRTSMKNQFITSSIIIGFLVLTTCFGVQAADSLSPLKKVPQNVTELWEGYDPRTEPLRTEVVREWKEDGVIVRYVRYFIGSFKGKPAWMAAFYAFPKGAKDLPGVLHMHGGGQRASLHLVKYHAKRGYAALSVNWGGRPMEAAELGEANTASSKERKRERKALHRLPKEGLSVRMRRLLMEGLRNCKDAAFRSISCRSAWSKERKERKIERVYISTGFQGSGEVK